MITFLVFLVASIGLLVFGVRTLGRVRYRIGEIALGLALLMGMFGVHAYHVLEVRKASDQIASAYVVLDQRLAKGEVEEVREVLDIGSRLFLRSRLRFSSTTTSFWETAISHASEARE